MKQINRIGKKQYDTIISLNLQEIQMVLPESIKETKAIIYWKRGALVDQSDEITILSKDG